MKPLPAVPFTTRLRELREEAGLGQEDLAFETRKHGTPVSSVMVRFYEHGRSRPGRERYESLAAALGVSPNEFAEYRLLVMREALDEKIVGLEVAMALLALVEAKTPASAQASSKESRRPKPLRQRHTPQEPSAPRKKREAS